MTTAALTTTPTAGPDDRVAQVFNWILSAASESEIRQAIETTWPDARVKPLIVSAMRRIEKSGNPDRTLALGWCIEAARSVYQKAAEAGDLTAMLAAIRLLHKLASGS
jgi:TPR repeat protein